MRAISKYTKFKVIAGYVILSLLSIILVIIIYHKISQLTESGKDVGDANQKLLIMGNTITNLYEAETLSNAFVQTNSENYFSGYLKIMDEVGQDIDSLKKLTTDLNQQLRIDSINILLEEKIQNLQELVEVKQSLAANTFYDKAIASIKSGRDSASHEMDVKKRIITSIDSSYVQQEKKRGFWRIFSRKTPDSTLIINLSHKTVYDTLQQDATLQNTDTVINILRNVWQDVQQQTQNVTLQINRKEFDLINQSTFISDRLKRIIKEFEKEEIDSSLSEIQRRDGIVRSTINIILIVAGVSLLLIIFFSFFILRDISRSQRYRKELEEEKNYTEELLDRREKLIQTVTHDIKSPLSSIMGYIELLNGMPIDERQRYYLKNMKGSSDHILRLVTNLLDLSKLENNKVVPEEIPFNPAQLCRELYDNFIPLAAAKKLTFTNRINPELNTSAKGDVLRIRQIITNILSNAIKYTSQGYVHFSAETNSENSEIILKIEDSGVGMNEDEQTLIFKEFTRLASGKHAEGTGLGLTITLKLIHLLGGTLKVTSEPEKGSCFEITLPLHKIEDSGNAATLIPEESKTLLSDSQTIKACLVDDDILQLEMASGLLRNNGVQTQYTTHPNEVIEELLKNRYDILISDIQMPELNGFELIRQIRAHTNEQLRNIPAIALSANAGKKEKDFLDAGFSGYLEKPFSSEKLLELISRLTGKNINENKEAIRNKNEEKTGNYTLKNILRFAGNDHEAAQKIICSLITETNKHIQTINKSLDKKEYEHVSKIAHKMLPLFRQLETYHIVQSLELLEKSFKTGEEELFLSTAKKATGNICHIIQEIKNDYSIE